MVTPDTGFGELIHQVLVDEGGFEVSFVVNGIAALAAAQQEDFSLAILDCEAGDVPFTELVTTLKDWHPEIRLIAIPPDNNPAHSSLKDVRPHAYLTKPFYLPELLKIVNRILDGGEVNVEKLAVQGSREDGASPAGMDRPAAGKDDYPWMEDVNRAAQYLARLSLETAARAALITRGDRLWAYAGELGQPAGDQLAAMVGQHWAQRSSALARFVKLDDEREYMLYATGLPDGMVLALIFNAETPFSKIRTQSSRMARALASEPGGGPQAAAGQAGEAMSGRQVQSKVLRQPDTQVPGRESERSVSDSGSGRQVEPTARRGAAPAELTAVESPGLPMDWLPQNLQNDRGLLAEVEEAIEPFAIPQDWQPRQEQGMAPGPRAYLEDLLRDPMPGGGVKQALEQTLAQVEDLERRPVFPPPEAMAETRPTRVPLPDKAFGVEPDSASFSSITYACVLLPRFPQHHLVQELARQLERWMFQVCVSFDWRLEQLAIRPGYMQWMVRVHSATAPRTLMQIVTRLTSQRILEQYPLFKDDNPSGEFWAPGWLVISSDTLPPPAMVQDFIAKTRRRQGVAA